MCEVKFVNEAKYRGVTYPAHTPFQVDDKDIEALIKEGAIVTIPPKSAGVAESCGKSIDAMKIDELREYAEKNNINLGKADRKSDILAAIKASRGTE